MIIKSARFAQFLLNQLLLNPFITRMIRRQNLNLQFLKPHQILLRNRSSQFLMMLIYFQILRCQENPQILILDFIHHSFFQHTLSNAAITLRKVQIGTSFDLLSQD